MRELCKFSLEILCVNNYRGGEYNKPIDCVNCEDCVLNPKNDGVKINPLDMDKVIKDEFQEIIVEKINKIKDGKKQR